MIKITELRTIELPFYSHIFNKVTEIFSSYEGTYYKLNIDGKEYILHRVNNYFTLFSGTKDDLSYKIFTVDKDYNIDGLELGDTIFNYVGGNLIARDKKTGIASNISLVERTNGNDNEGYNGYVLYVQYDQERDFRLVQTFQHMYNKDERIYDMHVKKPFNIVIEDQASLADQGGQNTKLMYIKDEYDLYDDPIGFSLATIKDYGLINYFKHGNSLQNSDLIDRYYRVLKVNEEGRAITHFPLCKQYDQNDMSLMIKELGFKPEIPELLLDIYNSDYPLLESLREIVEQVKQIELGEEEKINGYKLAA